jgi:hypothetical protein
LSICPWLENDIMAEPLESPHESVAGPLGVQLIKVVAADPAILSSISEDAECDHEQTMCGCHDRLANSMLAGLAIEECSQVTVLLARRSPCSLTERSSYPAISFARSIAESLAAALVISRTESCPTRGVMRSGEYSHI